MRIIVVGDFHLPEGDHHAVQQAVEDMNRAKPDLVVPLGDFGSPSKIGTPEGLKESYAHLSMLKSRIRPILGNHDLERETGAGVQAKGTMERSLKEMYALPSLYDVIELEHCRLFFISTENQAAEDCYQIQECFVSEEQFAWVLSKLEERPKVPAIFFTHAPPIGCGLKTVPEVHVRATNAYLDQNHEPMRWYKLFAEYPQIVMWFSAHYHLGHDHPDSMTLRYGTRFFHTGVHGAATRDKLCHSRVIDLDEHFVRVSTLDHRTGQVRAKADWEHQGPIHDLVEENHEIVPPVPTSFDPTLLGTVPVGIQGTTVTSIIPIDAKRCLIQGEDPYLWEVDIPTLSVLGTLQYSPDESFHTAVTPNDSFVWIGKGAVLMRISLESPLRFVRALQKKADIADQEYSSWELPFNIVGMVQVPSRSTLLWIASESELYSWDTERLKLEKHIVPADIQNIERLIADDDGIWIVEEEGTKRKYMIDEKDRLKYETTFWVENEQYSAVTRTIVSDDESADRYKHRVYACIAPTDPQSQAILQIWEKHIEY